MADRDRIFNVLSILRKRWSLLVVAGIIFSCLFMGVKYFNKNTYVLAPSDDTLIGKTLRLNDYKDSYDTLHYDRYLKSSSFLGRFIEETEEKYDYNKLAPGWNQKTNLQKISWIDKHIIVSYYGAGRIEIQLSIKQSEPIDLNYVSSHGEHFLDYFIYFADKKDALGSYTVITSVDLIPEKNVTSNNKVVLKYGIIGFVLGVVGMTTIILVCNMRKGNDGKH